MFEFFDMLVNLINSIVSGIGSFFDRIITVITLIATGAVAITQVYVFLPDIIRLFVGAFVSYCIIINLLNKGG